MWQVTRLETAASRGPEAKEVMWQPDDIRFSPSDALAGGKMHHSHAIMAVSRMPSLSIANGWGDGEWEHERFRKAQAQHL